MINVMGENKGGQIDCSGQTTGSQMSANSLWFLKIY